MLKCLGDWKRRSADEADDEEKQVISNIFLRSLCKQGYCTVHGEGQWRLNNGGLVWVVMGAFDRGASASRISV